MEWIYQNSDDDKARFILGTARANPLICFGVNPSTATPDKPDQTVRHVARIADFHGYDSYVIFNIYPQRATNPNDLHREFLPSLQHENEKCIASFIGGRKLSLWAAWGGLIKKRAYLIPLLRSIVDLPALKNCTWVSRGDLLKDGHPHHPLYVKKDAFFSPFDISKYIESM